MRALTPRKLLLALWLAAAVGAATPGAALAADCSTGNGSTTNFIGGGVNPTMFTEADNWSNGVPTGACTAVINGAGVDLEGGASFASLSLTGGASLNITGYTDSGGGAQQSTLSTNATVASGAAIHLTSTSADLSNGTHAINPGAAILAGTVNNSGAITTDVGRTGASSFRDIRADVTNNATGTITMHTDMSTCGCGAGGTWINNGTMTTDPGTTSVFTRTGAGISFTQPGGAFVNHGHAEVSGAFINSGGTTSGNPIELVGTLDAHGAGASSFEFDTLPSLGSSGGSLTGDIGSQTTVLIHNNTAANSAIGVTVATDVTNHGTLTLDGGPGQAQLIGSGSHVLTNAGILNLAADASAPSTHITTPIVNQGTMHMAADATADTNAAFTQSAGTFSLAAGSTFITSTATLSGGTITNAGSFTGATFTHNGGDETGNPIDLSGGTLDATGPGTASFTIAASVLAANTYTLGSDIGAGDSVRIAPGIAQVDVFATSFTNHGTLTVASSAGHLVQLHGTSLDNDGTLSATGSTFAIGLTNHGAASFLGTGALTTGLSSPITQAGGSLTVSGTLYAQGGASLLGGTVATTGSFESIGFSHTGGDASGNPIRVCSTLAAQGPGTAQFDLVPSAAGNPNGGCGGSAALTTDVGVGDTVEIQPASATFDVFNPAGMTNHGTVIVDTGASPALVQLHGQGQGPVVNAGSLTLGTGTGSVNVAGDSITNTGTMTVAAGATVNDQGPVNVSAGSLAVAGVLNAAGAISGGSATADGTWNVGGTLALTGGTLLGTGTVTGDVSNGGTVSPGDAAGPGTLSVSGAYTQLAAGQLSVRVAVNGNDTLAVSGTATLAGTLAVDGHGFTPPGGQTYRVLSDGSLPTGTFDTVTGQGYTVAYDAAGAKLVPAEVTTSPTAITFGSGSEEPVIVGTTTASRSTTLMNNGQSSVSVGSVTLGGAGASAFTITSDGCSNTTLAPGGSCVIAADFHPSTIGTATAALSIADSAIGSPQQVSLSGTGGVRAANATPQALTFSAAPGETSQQTITLQSSGQVTLDVGSAVLTGGSPFSLASENCSGQHLAPGRSCQVVVKFDPTAPGAYAATVTISDNASDTGTQSIAVSGDSAAVPTGSAGTITGRVLNAPRGDAPIAGSDVTACHGPSLAQVCRTETVGADGRYSFDEAAGPVTITAYPSIDLSSDTDTETVVAGVTLTHDFHLAGAKPLNGGVGFTTGFGSLSSGVPRLPQNNPYSIRAPIKISRTGTPNKVRVYVDVLGFGSNARTEVGSFYQAAALIFTVHYDGRGIADAVSRPLVGRVNCGNPSTGGCARLAARSGVDIAAAASLPRRARAVRGTGPTAATARVCPPEGEASLRANDLGGIDVVYHRPDGSADVLLNVAQVAIPVPPPSGDRFDDMVVNTGLGILNGAINLIPPIGIYNAIVGALNVKATLDSSNDRTLTALESGSDILTIAGLIGQDVHGPVGWFFSGASGIYNAAVGSVTNSNSPVTFNATEDCPDKTGDAYIDPSGTVRTTGGVPVSGAKVTLTTAPRAKAKASPVRNGSVIMSPSNRRNPDRTGLTGSFGWDTLPGFYAVTASKPGCRAPRGRVLSVTTPLFEVPPPRSNLVLVLRCPTLHRTATALSVKAYRGRLGSTDIVATIRAKRGRLRASALVGTVTFRAGSRYLAAVPVVASARRASVLIPRLRHPPRRYTASFSGNAALAPSHASGS